MTEKTFIIEMKIICDDPRQLRAFRDTLEDMCDDMVVYGAFDVYDEEGNEEIPYDEEWETDDSKDSEPPCRNCQGKGEYCQGCIHGDDI